MPVSNTCPTLYDLNPYMVAEWFKTQKPQSQVKNTVAKIPEFESTRCYHLS